MKKFLGTYLRKHSSNKVLSDDNQDCSDDRQTCIEKVLSIKKSLYFGRGVFSH